VVGDGNLFFAGSSSGGEEETEMAIPAYDSLLKDLDKDQDGALSRVEAEAAFEGFFDNQDVNKDGKITRQEWDAVIKLYSEGQNSAFALKSGASSAARPHLLWKKVKGLPYIASGILYRGQFVMVRDGGIITAYEAQTGDELYQGRSAAAGRYYASPVAANGNIYFTSLDGAVTVLKAASARPVVVAKNPDLGERTAATPAIADNTLYIRTATQLYAFSDKN
jgi:outer membrane protein assembly factor BamB